MPDVRSRCWVPGPMVSPTGHPRGLVPFITLMDTVARMLCLAQIGLDVCMMLVCYCYARPCRRAAGARKLKAPTFPPSFFRTPPFPIRMFFSGRFWAGRRRRRRPVCQAVDDYHTPDTVRYAPPQYFVVLSDTKFWFDRLSLGVSCIRYD